MATAKKPNACECCKFTPCEVKPYDIGPPVGGTKMLCELCANTMAGRTLDAGTYQPSNADLILAACYVGNQVQLRLARMLMFSSLHFTLLMFLVIIS